MPPLKEQLDEAQRHIAAHPGHVEYMAIKAFGRTLHDVFLDNWHDLLGLLDQASSNIMLATELVQNAHEPVVRHRFQATVSKRLHNYLASASTLVDHSRRLTRDRTGPITKEFSKRKDKLLSNGEVSFLKDLRNYTVHRELPGLCHRLEMRELNTPDWKMTSEVELAPAILLNWSGWSKASKKFIKSCGDAVEVRPVVRRHGELVYELNAWLFNSLAQANEPALAEVNRLVVERNAIITGGNLEAARAMSNPPWIGPSEHASG